VKDSRHPNSLLYEKSKHPVSIPKGDGNWALFLLCAGQGNTWEKVKKTVPDGTGKK